jgi:hypothetical protein
MKKRGTAFTSNKIIQNEAKKLVAEKILQNMNFKNTKIKEEANRNSYNNFNSNNIKPIKIKDSNKEDYLSSQKINASEVMSNFFIKKNPSTQTTQTTKLQKNVTRQTRENSVKRQVRGNSEKIIKKRSSHSIAKDVQNTILKNESSVYDNLINNTVDQGGKSFRMSRSILDMSMNKSRIGASKERKNEESALKYDDYIKDKPSTSIHHNKATSMININFSCSENSVINQDQDNSVKASMLESFLNQNLGTNYKLVGNNYTLRNSSFQSNRGASTRSLQHVNNNINTSSKLKSNKILNSVLADESVLKNSKNQSRESKFNNKQEKSEKVINNQITNQLKNQLSTPVKDEINADSKINFDINLSSSNNFSISQNPSPSNVQVKNQTLSKIFELKLQDTQEFQTERKKLSEIDEKIIFNNSILDNKLQTPFKSHEKNINSNLQSENLSSPNKYKLGFSPVVISPIGKRRVPSSNLVTLENDSDTNLKASQKNENEEDDLDCANVEEFEGEERSTIEVRNFDQMNNYRMKSAFNKVTLLEETKHSSKGKEKTHRSILNLEMTENEKNQEIDDLLGEDYVYQENMNHLDNIMHNDGPIRHYDEIVNKLLFSSNPFQAGIESQSLSVSHNVQVNTTNLNDSRISRVSLVEKDLESVQSIKNSMKGMQLIYKKEILKLQEELKELEDVKSFEFEKIKTRKENEIRALKEKILKEGEKNEKDGDINTKDSELTKTKDKKTKKLLNELETLKSNLLMKENNYKTMINNLLGEWKNLTSNSQIVNNLSVFSNSDIPDLNDSMIRDINEVMEDSILDEVKKNSQNGNLNSGSKNKQENILGSGINMSNFTPSTNATLTGTKKEYSQKTEMEPQINLEEDSMMVELEEFKQDDLGNYTFDIPLKYKMNNSARVESEDLKKDGKLVRYYNNSVVEILAKNKTVSRVRKE